MTFVKIKRTLCRASNVPVSSIRLELNGHELDDNMTLRSAALPSGSVIMLHIVGEGGIATPAQPAIDTVTSSPQRGVWDVRSVGPCSRVAAAHTVV